MDDMRLDPASKEPARQPEAVATSFIGQCNPPDQPASTHRLDAPPLDQSQQCRRIRLQLLQRLALDAGNNAAHEPTRLAHLDDHHQGRDRIKHGQTSAEIIDLRHGVPPSVRMDDEGATTSAAPSHSFSYLRYVTAKRWLGQGWRIRGCGSQSSISRFIRAQVRSLLSLRRVRTLSQRLAISARNATSARRFVGTAW